MYLICVLLICLAIFSCLENHIREPRVPIPKTKKFEKYYDSEEIL